MMTTETSRLKFYCALPTRATASSTHHQSLPSGNLHDTLREPHPTEGRQQEKEELQSGSLWNINHIHRKIDKMKRQGAMYQMKEQDKTAEKQLNEMEIGNLPEKEFRIMIVKMIQDLGKRMESKLKKMQEMFNNDLEELKNKQTEKNKTISEMKNTLEGINSRITEAEERISDLEDRMVEFTAAE